MLHRCEHLRSDLHKQPDVTLCLWDPSTGKQRQEGHRHLLARQSILKEGPGSVEYPVSKKKPWRWGEEDRSRPLVSVWLCRDMAPAHIDVLMQKSRLGPGRGKERMTFPERQQEWVRMVEGALCSQRTMHLLEQEACLTVTFLPSTSPNLCLCLHVLTCE